MPNSLNEAQDGCVIYRIYRNNVIYGITFLSFYVYNLQDIRLIKKY